MATQEGPDTWSRILGGIAVIGCLAAVITDLSGAALSDRIGLFSDTISNLAAGNYDDVADLGIYAFAAGVLATTAGLLRWRIDRWDWKIGVWLLVVVAVCVTLIAGYEAYSTGDGPVIHYRLVYVLGIIFPLTVLLTAGQFWEIRKWLGAALYALGVIWMVLGPIFYWIPTGYDGAYERLLALMMLGWFVTMGVMIWRNPNIVREVSEEQRGHD